LFSQQSKTLLPTVSRIIGDEAKAFNHSGLKLDQEAEKIKFLKTNNSLRIKNIIKYSLA
jgi:hypothetical protein